VKIQVQYYKNNGIEGFIKISSYKVINNIVRTKNKEQRAKNKDVKTKKN